MNLVHVGYKSVNCYALQSGDGYLLIDVGMPGSFGELVATLRRKSVPLERVRCLLVTHFHPDHCGVAQEVKAAGATLLLGDCQADRLAESNRALAGFAGYQPIATAGNHVIATGNPADWREATGIAGVLLHTPGHSDDSVTVVIDGLGAFVGDLRLPDAYAGRAAAQAAASWQRIRAAGARQAFPGHGSPFDLDS